MAVLRFIACAVIFMGGLVLLIRGNRDAYDLMLFPLVGFVPAAIFTGVVLYPIERIALTRNQSAHLVWALPLAGAMFPFVTLIVLALIWAEPSAISRMGALGPAAALPAAMGFVWGFLWWITGVGARLLRN